MNPLDEPMNHSQLCTTTIAGQTIAGQTIAGHEIAALLRQVGQGTIDVQLANAKHHWDSGLATNVEFLIAGYRIVVFNDCDQLDYVDSAIAPDGRMGDFAVWFSQGEEPVTLLTREEQAAIQHRLKIA